MQPDNGKDRGAPARGIEITVWQVPDSPTRGRVRFLAPVNGLYVHYRKCLIPCGHDKCDSGLHRLPRSWRGYAPVEVLDTRNRVWVPAVLEVTERLWWCLEGYTLRGTVWDVLRRPGRRDREECWGEQIDEADPQKLRTDIDTVAAVRRLYRNAEITWNQWPDLGKPQQLALSVWENAPPFPLAEADQRMAAPHTDERLSAEDMRALIAKAKAAISGPQKEGGKP